MARLPRKMSNSAIYHVMIRGNEKRDIFLDDEDRLRFIYTLRLKKQKRNFELYAYCLMRNHVHLLINEADDSIAQIMKSINISYAMYFNRKYDRVGHLFQDRFRSEEINSGSYLLAASRYIHNNPVEAGIAKKPGDYIWSSYYAYAGKDSIPGLLDLHFLLGMFSDNPDKAAAEFLKFTNMMSDDKFIDIEPEAENNKIMTRKKALEYLESVVLHRGITLDEIREIKGKVKGTIKHELVKNLKENTNLSCREIGELLGLNKSTVQELN